MESFASGSSDSRDEFPKPAIISAGVRKRSVKACDRCRVKKVKCCGNAPCERCQHSDAICHFGAHSIVEGKPIPPARALQLQNQRDILVKALRVLWNRGANPDGSYIIGLEEPSVHHIVQSTGALDQAIDPVNPVDATTLFNDLDHSFADETEDTLHVELMLGSQSVGHSTKDISVPDDTMLDHPMGLCDSPQSLSQSDQFPGSSPDHAASAESQKSLETIAIRRSLRHPLYCTMPPSLKEEADDFNNKLYNQHMYSSSLPCVNTKPDISSDYQCYPASSFDIFDELTNVNSEPVAGESLLHLGSNSLFAFPMLADLIHADISRQ